MSLIDEFFDFINYGALLFMANGCLKNFDKIFIFAIYSFVDYF